MTEEQLKRGRFIQSKLSEVKDNFYDDMPVLSLIGRYMELVNKEINEEGGGYLEYRLDLTEVAKQMRESIEKMKQKYQEEFDSL